MNSARRPAPLSTYRLQLRREFTLADAEATLDYIHDLGADWLYLSPLLEATPGSSHGYDTVSHSRIDPERGGTAGLLRLAAACHERGMGILLDIVPNHVGVARAESNRWWWDVLGAGAASPYAGHFDIDWAYGSGRVRIPILGEASAAEAAERGALRIEDGELRYHDHRFPLAAGSADDGADAATVQARQHYELVHWRRADAELNYRRFFAVNELAAVRVESERVFGETHALIAALVGAGLVDGLRVDHPDGLADPAGYLDALAAATGGAYVLVEKILEQGVGERLPSGWATAGTTGYDALALVDRVLVDPDGVARMHRLDAALRGGEVAWDELAHAGKRQIADTILGSEVARLVRDLHADGILLTEPDGTETGDARLVDAMAEMLACFPVYRSYLPDGSGWLDRARDAALARRRDLSGPIEQLHAALGASGGRASTRFQQTSGMIMAKGVEDTAFYRTSVLGSLTEVGADPSIESITVGEWHAAQTIRLRELPLSMTALSTHDTKRSEDTRARIDALSEIPDEWAGFLSRRMAAHPLGDPVFENLLWQAVVGSWPRERDALHGYAEKAAREGGTSTSWHDPDREFERRMHALVDALFDDPAVTRDVEGVVGRIGPAGRSNGLAAKLLQLTMPGVPDVYQGSELWERSLVDPDNRRRVDYAKRRELLEAIDSGWLPPIDADGAAKLLVTSRTLRLRRDRPELFGAYLPLDATGPGSAHVVAADHGGAVTVVTRLPIGLTGIGGWQDTRLALPGAMVDALTGRAFDGSTRIAGLLQRYPVALLIPEGRA